MDAINNGQGGKFLNFFDVEDSEHAEIFIE